MPHVSKAQIAHFSLLSALLTGAASPAMAGEQPLYQPAPGWVAATPAADVPDTGPTLRVVDVQKRIDHGTVWTYAATARRIDTPEGLARSGTVTLSWAPDHGDLIVHGVTILRGGERIDAMAGDKRFTVLRREAKLESLQLNGTLTATLSIEGLQVGDVVETRYSVTEKDPAMQGHVGTGAPLLAQPAQLGFGRVRVLWNEADRLRWKTYLGDVIPGEKQQPGGWHEWLVTLPVARQPDQAAQVPGRYIRPAMVEFSDFADWADVSRTMMPLYRVDVPSAAITTGGDLDKQVAAIAAATPDPRKRTAMALQMVQDKVRYFAVAMNGGNLVPQTPEQTWAMRYGDCKAKTLLLLAVLHKLGIEAEGALANLGNGDLVHDRLPSVAAFDHIMVLAHVGGSVLWLDGTGLGSREADLDDVPAYGWVLPLRSGGADLLQAPPRPPARPMSEVHFSIDMRGGVGLAAPFQVTLTMRGGLAGQINTALANLDKEGKAELLRRLLGSGQSNRIFVQPQFTYDPVAGGGSITAIGVAQSGWRRADSRYTFDTGLARAGQYPDRSRSIWQAVPVALGRPQYSVVEESFQLPRRGAGITQQGGPDGQRSYPAGGSNRVHAELRDGVWRLSLEERRGGGEVPAADIPAMRQQDADFVAKMPSLRTDAGYPAPWQNVEASKRDHLFDQTVTILGQWIDEKPEDAERWHLRANFYVEIFERQKAIADLDKALGLKSDKVLYRERASLYEAVGDRARALADFRAAFDLDPSDQTSLSRLTFAESVSGAGDAALTRLNGLIANGGEREPFYRSRKAEVLALRGDKAGAVAEVDAALAKRPSNAGLLNDRCWIKGLLAVDLDNAAADCSRAIQIGGNNPGTALGSRGLVLLRQHRAKEAVADFNQALDLRPNQSLYYFLRALAQRDAGDAEAAKGDLASARLLNPALEQYYAGFGLKW
jgi:tetratricopeptide (TPR) repeat protein